MLLINTVEVVIGHKDHSASADRYTATPKGPLCITTGGFKMYFPQNVRAYFCNKFLTCSLFFVFVTKSHAGHLNSVKKEKIFVVHYIYPKSAS